MIEFLLASVNSYPVDFQDALATCVLSADERSGSQVHCLVRHVACHLLHNHVVYLPDNLSLVPLERVDALVLRVDSLDYLTVDSAVGVVAHAHAQLLAVE